MICPNGLGSSGQDAGQCTTCPSGQSNKGICVPQPSCSLSQRYDPSSNTCVSCGFSAYSDGGLATSCRWYGGATSDGGGGCVCQGDSQLSTDGSHCVFKSCSTTQRLQTGVGCLPCGPGGTGGGQTYYCNCNSSQTYPDGNGNCVCYNGKPSADGTSCLPAQCSSSQFYSVSRNACYSCPANSVSNAGQSQSCNCVANAQPNSDYSACVCTYGAAADGSCNPQPKANCSTSQYYIPSSNTCATCPSISTSNGGQSQLCNCPSTSYPSGNTCVCYSGSLNAAGTACAPASCTTRQAYVPSTNSCGNCPSIAITNGGQDQQCVCPVSSYSTGSACVCYSGSYNAAGTGCAPPTCSTRQFYYAPYNSCYSCPSISMSNGGQSTQCYCPSGSYSTGQTCVCNSGAYSPDGTACAPSCTTNQKYVALSNTCVDCPANASSGGGQSTSELYFFDKQDES